MAALIGAASGLASTGTNQIFKQMEKLGISVKKWGRRKKIDLFIDKNGKKWYNVIVKGEYI